MRRKARLQVLYWPTLASVSIILILLAFGTVGERFRPGMIKTWAGGGLGASIPSWLAASKPLSTVLAWVSLEYPSELRARLEQRPVSPPRTLVKQSESDLLERHSGVEVRNDVDHTDLPRSFHSPHALRSQASTNAFDLAQAKLYAPVRSDVEELAGLDHVSKDIMRLASQMPVSNVSEESVTLDTEALQNTSSSEANDSPKRAGGTARRGHGLGGGWPETPQLIRDLEAALRIASRNNHSIRFASTSASEFSLQAWKDGVTESLYALHQLPSVHAAEAGEHLDRLRQLASEGLRSGETIEDRETQIQVLSTAHALDRRLAVWQSVWRTTQGSTTRVSDLEAAEGNPDWAFHDVGPLLVEVQRDVEASEDPAGWATFLMLDELQFANDTTDREERRLCAQRFLSRMSWHRLEESHRTWLDRASIQNLSLVLRRWAARPLDYAALLGQIERQESDSIDLGGIDVASAVQTLRFAESREANRIAEALNTYYRNANIRIAVTDELIGRLMPEVDSKVQPVRDRILGADVRGTSLVKTDLRLKLIPSQQSWKMILENHGTITTGASSRQWPVRIRSHSDAQFLSSTPLEITPDGAVSDGTSVDVSSSTRVRGVNSDFDSIPLINTLVREIAMSRYDSVAPLAARIQQGKIRGGVSSEVDRRVNEQLDDAAATLTKRLTGPLGTLQLNPLVVDMQTTSERLSARYRVAGDWQLAAFTPRPRAPQASLLSVQMHQSVINNTLETILPAGQPQSIASLIDQVRRLFSVEKAITLEEDEEVIAETAIQFASTRPITIEIENDVLWITMRVIQLKQGNNLDLRRFIVRAAYRPEVSGMSAKLVRDGHLRISGPNMSMRDRLPVRAIFNKVFSTKRSLPLVPDAWSGHTSLEGLAITQVELRDGWLALAVGQAGQSSNVMRTARAEDDDSETESY